MHSAPTSNPTLARQLVSIWHVIDFVNCVCLCTIGFMRLLLLSIISGLNFTPASHCPGGADGWEGEGEQGRNPSLVLAHPLPPSLTRLLLPSPYALRSPSVVLAPPPHVVLWMWSCAPLLPQNPDEFSDFHTATNWVGTIQVDARSPCPLGEFGTDGEVGGQEAWLRWWCRNAVWEDTSVRAGVCEG